MIWEIERSVFWTRLRKNAHGPGLEPLNRAGALGFEEILVLKTDPALAHRFDRRRTD